MSEQTKVVLAFTIFMLMVLSVFGSMARVAGTQEMAEIKCNATYYIDYILPTKLFCEVKDE